MRGLTPMERRLLNLRANNGPRVPYPHDHPVCRASEDLERAGRIYSTIETCDGEDFFFSHITDLGRLALRVCPVDES